MIRALEATTQGLLNSQRRATTIAKDIVQETSKSAPSQNKSGEPTNNKPLSNGILGHNNSSNLIQQLADLRSEKHAFTANAKAFKRIDETLGSLLDDKS